MDRNRLDRLIQRHEGLRLAVYVDSVGVPTVGYGHALHKASAITHEAAIALFEGDIEVVMNDYKRMVLEGSLPANLCEARQAVIYDMLFNLGRRNLLKFKNFLVSLKIGDWQGAVRHMKASLWARQVGRRAEELANMMETGLWPEWLASQEA